MNEKWQNSVGKFFKVQSSVQVFGIFFQSINQSMESIKDEKKLDISFAYSGWSQLNFNTKFFSGRYYFDRGVIFYKTKTKKLDD